MEALGHYPQGPLREAYLDACEAELKAFKPGNVSVYSEGHAMTVEDFRRSAQVSAPYLTDPRRCLGEKIFHAVRATRLEVGCNTNLGIVLLCAPLLHAMREKAGRSLRERVQKVLASTTLQDAVWAYRAIRLAQPAGLGRSTEQDVYGAPQVSLTEAMRLASRRDRIAFQYAHGYQDVFELALPRYHNALAIWGNESLAAVAMFSALLRRMPDSHIERKFGKQFTRMVTTRMALLDEELSKPGRPEQIMQRLKEIDAEFKSFGINPGTTADLTVATLLAARLENCAGSCHDPAQATQ